jgi:hypothetical protein
MLRAESRDGPGPLLASRPEVEIVRKNQPSAVSSEMALVTE